MTLFLRKDMVSLRPEIKYCPICQKKTETRHVVKPDVELEVCKDCGSTVSILYNDS